MTKKKQQFPAAKAAASKKPLPSVAAAPAGKISNSAAMPLLPQQPPKATIVTAVDKCDTANKSKPNGSLVVTTACDQIAETRLNGDDSDGDPSAAAAGCHLLGTTQTPGQNGQAVIEHLVS